MAKRQSFLDAMRKVLEAPDKAWVQASGTMYERLALDWFTQDSNKFGAALLHHETKRFEIVQKRVAEKEKAKQERRKKRLEDPGAERTIDLIESFFLKRSKTDAAAKSPVPASPQVA